MLLDIALALADALAVLVSLGVSLMLVLYAAVLVAYLPVCAVARLIRRIGL